MSRPFNSSLWAQPGIPFEPNLQHFPFAEEANRLQYRPWEVRRRSWIVRLLKL